MHTQQTYPIDLHRILAHHNAKLFAKNGNAMCVFFVRETTSSWNLQHACAQYTHQYYIVILLFVHKKTQHQKENKEEDESVHKHLESTHSMWTGHFDLWRRVFGQLYRNRASKIGTRQVHSIHFVIDACLIWALLLLLVFFIYTFFFIYIVWRIVVENFNPLTLNIMVIIVIKCSWIFFLLSFVSIGCDITAVDFLCQTCSPQIYTL